VKAKPEAISPVPHDGRECRVDQSKVSDPTGGDVRRQAGETALSTGKVRAVDDLRQKATPSKQVSRAEKLNSRNPASKAVEVSGSLTGLNSAEVVSVVNNNSSSLASRHLRAVSSQSSAVAVLVIHRIELEEIPAEEEDNVVTTMIPKTDPEGWEEPQTILVILAHPDDPEFFCGATIARWTQSGHCVHYCLLTHGDKGVRDRSVDPAELSHTRELEQRGAADVLGVSDLVFLNFEDGYLVPDLAARKAVTRAIRQFKPDIIMSCDPTYIFGENSVNHPDHRAAGQIVVDAFFPAAGNPMYFSDLLIEEGLEPISPKELWLSVTGSANTTIDVTPFWEKKIEALHCHASQINDMKQLDERIRGRHTPDSSPENPRYEEKFRRLKFR